MQKRMRNGLIIIGAFLVLSALGVGSALITKQWLAGQGWGNPSLAGLADGDYTGQASLELPPGAAVANGAVKLVVQVRDQRYAAITLVEPAGIASAMEELGKEVLARQSLEIDGLSGATATKLVYLRAIADAVGRP